MRSWRVGLTATHVKALVLLLSVVVVAASTWAMRAQTESVPLLERSPAPIASHASSHQAPSNPPPSASGAGATNAVIQVHVTGQVRRPGVVRLPPGARVHQAITAAGGVTPQAHLGSLNLAAVLGDGAQVVVAGSDADESVVSGQPPTDAGTTGPGSGTNLNTATLAELEELPGVGPVTAGAILAWREQHGRFTTVEELQEVDGIGPKTYAKLAPHVTV